MKMKCLCLALGLLVASAAVAQGPERGTVTQACIALLVDASIRKEIKLSKQQDAEVQSEFKRMNGELQKVFSKRPKDAADARAAQEKIKALQMSLVTRLQSRLNSPQAKRLREIGLQRFGPFSMLSPEIQSELKLNSSQVGKIKTAQKWLSDQTMALQTKRRKEVDAIPKPKDRNDRKAVEAYVKKVNALMKKNAPSDQKALETYKKQAESKVLSVLSKTQSAQWKAMLGKPFA